MPAHIACQPASSRLDGAAGCFVVCREHGLRQSFGTAHRIAEAACVEHNRLHHPDPRLRTAELLSIVYASRATRGFGSDRLEQMLTQARARNRAFGITGMLLSERGAFLQALEGPRILVDDLMRTIECDPRHHDVRVLLRETRQDRRFPDWAMASGFVGQVEARPLEEFYEALLFARGAAEGGHDHHHRRTPAGRARPLTPQGGPS